jgi:hypothetical protein
MLESEKEVSDRYSFFRDIFFFPYLLNFIIFKKRFIIEIINDLLSFT